MNNTGLKNRIKLLRVEKVIISKFEETQKLSKDSTPIWSCAIGSVCCGSGNIKIE
ncbi:MAG: hypothetical protein ACEPOW_05760 [Bacteroidales bacterium]